MLLSLASLPVSAQLVSNPYASAQVEHDSNVYRVPDSQFAAEQNRDPTLADTDTKVVAGYDGTYLWSLQKLHANFEARRIDYDHYSDLNHSEYLGNVGLDWKAGSLVDGSLQYRQEQTAASFADINSFQLQLNVDHNAVARVNFNLSPEWRLETGANWHVLDAPLQADPNFVEREVGTHLGLSYLGVTHLTYGIGLDHVNGRFENAPGVGPYTQTAASFHANYSLDSKSSIDGLVGYTKRTQELNANNFSTVTGQLGVNRQLTGKTSVSLRFVRAVNNYVVAAGSETDTTASVGLTWQATYKTTVAANYSHVRTSFDGQFVPGAVATGRLDQSPNELLNVTYQALRRLQIKAYLAKQSRQSNFFQYNYSDTLLGLQFQVHWR